MRNPFMICFMKCLMWNLCRSAFTALNRWAIELKTLYLYLISRLWCLRLMPYMYSSHFCLQDMEYLHLIFPKDVYGLDKWNLEEAETINILTRHLKKVEFFEFDEEKPKLVVACALLEHGNELEEMVSVGVMKPGFMKGQWRL